MTFFWFLVFGLWFFFKCFSPIKINLAFIWGIVYFCTMDGFLRILEKTSSQLICTQLYKARGHKLLKPPLVNIIIFFRYKQQAIMIFIFSFQITASTNLLFNLSSKRLRFQIFNAKNFFGKFNENWWRTCF